MFGLGNEVDQLSGACWSFGMTGEAECDDEGEPLFFLGVARRRNAPGLGSDPNSWLGELCWGVLVAELELGREAPCNSHQHASP